MSEREDLKNKLIEMVEEHFPKDVAKERGQAMVVTAKALLLFEAEKAALAHQLKSTGPEDHTTLDYTGNESVLQYIRGENDTNKAWRAHIDAVLSGGGKSNGNS